MTVLRYLVSGLIYLGFISLNSCSHHFITIREKNNIFIIATSGIHENDWNTSVILENSKLKNELKFLIKLLPEDSHFNLLFIENEFKPWRLQFVKADYINKNTALLTLDAFKFETSNLLLTKSFLDSMLCIINDTFNNTESIDIFIIVDKIFSFIDKEKFSSAELDKLKKMKCKINFVIYEPNLDCDICFILSKVTGGKVIFRH